MDTIEMSNLNRQFLFRCTSYSCTAQGQTREGGAHVCACCREEHIKQSKAEVAAAAIMQRCPGVSVKVNLSPFAHVLSFFFGRLTSSRLSRKPSPGIGNSASSLQVYLSLSL